MRVNKIDFHFSKLRYQPDFEHFSDEEFNRSRNILFFVLIKRTDPFRRW